MRVFVSCLLFILSTSAFAQNSYWVFLSDKDGVQFDPYTYFDAKAIERRVREGISIRHISDYPLREDYVQQVTALCDSVTGVSRWFNAMACRASDEQINIIRQLSCVREITPMLYLAVPASANDTISDELDEDEKKELGILHAQTERMEYSLLKQKGYTGKGVRVAIFDAGFPKVETNPSFDHIVKNKRIVATYDFVRNRENVYRASTHGTHVLSCIAGIRDSIPMGCATDAEFLLARTENAFYEARVEEDNWIESLEWADKLGADIVNSSLGYTIQFYFRRDMDGKTSLITKAANMALSKGILVVNSAGNEGNNRWEIIGAPADADSVLTIGGIDPWTGYHTGFSSYGPTSDYRRKPNLAAFSHVVTALGTNTGTSFSSPLVAGFAACIRQMHPEWTAKQLFDELEKSGELFPYFDYAHGFGVPKASYFTEGKKEYLMPPLRFEWDAEWEQLNVFEIKLDEDSSLTSDYKEFWTDKMLYSEPYPYFYWQLTDTDGRIVSYSVVEPDDYQTATIDNDSCPDCLLRITYKRGYFEKPWNQLIEELKLQQAEENIETIEEEIIEEEIEIEEDEDE